jgi:hypothetical protein
VSSASDIEIFRLAGIGPSVNPYHDADRTRFPFRAKFSLIAVKQDAPRRVTRCTPHRHCPSCTRWNAAHPRLVGSAPLNSPACDCSALRGLNFYKAMMDIS